MVVGVAVPGGAGAALAGAGGGGRVRTEGGTGGGGGHGAVLARLVGPGGVGVVVAGLGVVDGYGQWGERGARRGVWGEAEVDVGWRLRAWRRRGERERWWRGLGVGVVYGRGGEGEVDTGRRWRSWWRPGEQEWQERGPRASWWRLGERERREWVVEARWRCGECGCRGRVCRAGGDRDDGPLRDRASSLESGQSGGVGGSWGASRGAAWYWGGGEVPRRPWIRHVREWSRQRLVV